MKPTKASIDVRCLGCGAEYADGTAHHCAGASQPDRLDAMQDRLEHLLALRDSVAREIAELAQEMVELHRAMARDDPPSERP